LHIYHVENQVFIKDAIALGDQPAVGEGAHPAAASLQSGQLQKLSCQSTGLTSDRPSTIGSSKLT
jgi:hypothetical protein